MSWVIDEGATLFDFAKLSGSFSYDSDSGTYSDANITSEAGFMVSCSDVGTPGDAVCDGFSFAEFVDGFSFDSGVTRSGISGDGAVIAEPNLFGFLAADSAANGLISRALFLDFLGVELVSGTVTLAMTEWFCTTTRSCGFRVESTVFMSGEGSVSRIQEPSTVGLFSAGLLGLAFVRRRKAA